MNALIIENPPLVRLDVKQLIDEADPKATVAQSNYSPGELVLADHKIRPANYRYTRKPKYALDGNYQ